MLNGTSVVKLSDFINDLKEFAGTCQITKSEYDNNPNKLCSFSHINKNFYLSWNNCLELANIKPNRILSQPIKQGRKLKDRSKEKQVDCLKCGKLFISFDPKINRICKICKEIISESEINNILYE